MVLIRENHEKRALAKEVTLACQFKVDRELVLRCQETAPPDRRVWRGQPLGTLSDIWPWSDMKDLVKREAEQFVGYMKQQHQRYDLMGSYTEMELWGPYMQKVDMSKTREDYRESDGHTYPMGYTYKSDAVDFGKGVVFLIRGRFLGKYGRMVEGVEKELLIV